jgi:glycosyltransferase involved in cell wall biosynthesis
MQDYEIVIINDGSVDGTTELLNQIQKKDQRIRVIHQKNSGVSLTRQHLIREASGKYVLFCDADDTMDSEALNTVYGAMTANKFKADLFIFGYKLVNQRRNKEVLCRKLSNGTYSRAEYAKYHINGLSDLYFSVLWNKCFKRNLFFEPSEIVFETLIEDVIFNVDYIARCSNICIVEKPIYNYIQIGESLTRNQKIDTKKSVLDALSAYKTLHEKLIRTYPKYQYKINTYICFRIMMLKSRAQKINDTAVVIQIDEVINEYRRKLGALFIIIYCRIGMAIFKRSIKNILMD